MVFLTQRPKGTKAQSVLSGLASLRLGDFALKGLYPQRSTTNEQRGQVPAEKLLRLAHQVQNPALRKPNSTENREEPDLHSQPID
jgi:hypothetical protein